MRHGWQDGCERREAKGAYVQLLQPSEWPEMVYNVLLSVLTTFLRQGKSAYMTAG